jgi:hypothetical protein
MQKNAVDSSTDGPLQNSMDNVKYTSTATKSEIIGDIAAIGHDLAVTFGDLLARLPGAPQPAGKIGEILKVDKALAVRLLAAVRQKDPLATAHVIPGPDPLARVVKAAGRKGVPADVLRPSSEAVSAFRALIKVHGGDRSGLDAIIAASLPDTRIKFESVAKQSMYRGVRQLKGIAADVVAYTVFAHPSDDPGRYDLVNIEGFFGLRRVRPGADVKLGSRSEITAKTPDPCGPFTLDGLPAGEFEGVLLRPFCSSPQMKLAVHLRGNDAIYVLDWGESVGCSSACDVVMAEVRRRLLRRSRKPDDPRPKSGFVYPISLPSRVFVCDLILHKDVYPGLGPRLRILELGQLGTAEVNDTTRDVDVLDVIEHVEPLGWGISSFRAAEIPRYGELLEHVCGKLGWNPGEFRGFRTRIEYPMFGSQVQLAFDVPLSDTSTTAPQRGG